MNILHNFKIVFFGFQTFGVRCPRSVKPARIRQNSDWIRIRIQGSTAYRGRLTPFLKHSLPIVIKISFRSRYRAPDPDPKNRILTPAFRLCLPWQVKHIFFIVLQIRYTLDPKTTNSIEAIGIHRNLNFYCLPENVYVLPVLDVQDLFVQKIKIKVDYDVVQELALLQCPNQQHFSEHRIGTF